MKIDLRHAVCGWLVAGLAACSHGQGEASAPATTSPAASGPVASAVNSHATPTAPGTPGGTIDLAANAPIGTAIDGEIAKPTQNDYYRFDNTAKLRDLAVIRLQNRSTTLRPYMKFYNADRSQLVENYDGTPGASVERTLTLEPGETLYVQVLPYNSTGKYTLTVTPQKAYDAHEPNDDALSATPTKIGTTNEGSIMDDRDPDWFRISGATTKTVHVVLDNASSTLRPYVKVYSATKSQITEKYDGTAGANLDFTVDIEPGKDFYLQVVPFDSTGKYRLTATNQANAPASSTK